MDHTKTDSPAEAAARAHVLKLVRLRKAEAIKAKAPHVSGWQAVADELRISRGSAHHIAHGRLKVPAHVVELVILRRAFARAGRWLGSRRRSLMRGDQ